MRTPKLKKGPEDVVRFLEFISAWRPPLSWCSKAYLFLDYVVVFIPFSQVEYNRGGDDHTL